jgi:hypothetical protein
VPQEKLWNGVDKTGRGFEYVRNKFPNVNDAKIKADIYIYILTQIRELMQVKEFNEDPNESDINAWLSFKRICNDLLGNHKAANYQDIVQDLLNSYNAMGFNMSLKILILESHLDFFQKISPKSVTNPVKDFTKTLWLWKNGIKARQPQVCWQTIAGQ